jgi:hypothetical protein
MATDTVNLPLDYYCNPPVYDGSLGFIQTIQQFTLVEDGGFWGVEILGGVVICGSPTESNQSPSLIGYTKHDPIGKTQRPVLVG